MRIGILTYYKVKNFGANLQAVSTYMYLKNNGHEPVFISYILKEGLAAIEAGKDDEQWQAHLNFVNSVIKEQTPICQTAEDVLKVVDDYKLQGIIAGSDALLQHHPFITRIRKARRKIIFIMPVTSDRLFPNLCWGCGIADNVPMALMSVSSQNSEYNLFLPSTKKKMRLTLNNLRYIAVRDTWTQDMVRELTDKEVPVSPDPVFAFNQNASSLVPSKEEILNKFNLPEKYALLSLFTQSLSERTIAEIKEKLNKEGILLGILPLPTGIHFNHNADFEIPLPLTPINWYALLKYSSAYIGCNMHPIVTCLHNAVPCFSIDNWGRVNFWGEKINDGSSKVEHIMKVFGLSENHVLGGKGGYVVSADDIVNKIMTFPSDKVREKSADYLTEYNKMMDNLIKAIS